MEDPVVITQLRIEDVKRVEAVELTPAASGLTVIGGNNCQGKSSVLDAIMAALLGEKYTPTNAVRDGAEKGEISLSLSNGIEVVRTFTAKGAYLKVSDPEGKRAGQQLLNGLMAELALNLGGFMRADSRAKAKTLLDALGINTQPFEERLRKLEAERLLKGRERDRAKGHAESLPYHAEAGSEPLDGHAMVQQMEQALQHNAAVRQARDEAGMLAFKLQKANQRVDELQRTLDAAKAEARELFERSAMAQQAADSATPVDTTTLQREVQQIDAHNAMVRDNLAREKAFADAQAMGEEWRAIDQQVTQVREELRSMLDGGKLPLPGLTIEEGELRYGGRAWDCMSGAERLQVATAVVHLLNPRCGFVLLDGLEQMDLPTLRTFTAWLRERRLQAIGTRVSTGAECTIIIEDGRVATSTDDPSFA